MRKYLSIILMAALVLCAMLMVACDDDQPVGHQHTLVDTVVEPRCDREGYTIHTCTECNETWRDTFVPADAEAHKFSVVETVGKTCTTEGYVREVCEYCAVENKTVTPASHEMGEWKVTIKPNCTEWGEERRHCEVCGGNQETRALEPRHTYYAVDDVVTEPTCTEKGYTTHYCAKCDYTYTDKVVSAKGHNWMILDTVNGDQWVMSIQGTCTSHGEEYRKCGTCSFIEKRSTGYYHIYSDKVEVTAPTCTEHGYTTYTCKLCGDKKLDDYIDPTHSYGKWTTYIAPTCTTEGIDQRTCKSCGHVDQRFTDPKHTFIKSDVVVEPTKFESGYTEYHCACGLVEKRDYTSATGSIGLEYSKKQEYNSSTNTYVEYYVVVGIGTCTDKEIAIPSEYNGLPVLRIGDAAFQNCKQITKVYIPTSVKSFALAAFWGCSNIERFEYEGTIDQWLAINKSGDSWNTGLDKDCTVRCEDGVISGDGTIFRD